jgi:fructokinase
MSTLAGILVGSSKFTCAIGQINQLNNIEIKNKIIIPTTTPSETLPQAIKFLQAMHAETPIKAIGIATFGPIDLDQNSPHYGYITTPPKPGWGHCNIFGTFKNVFNVPIGFDTNVNAAAVGEYRSGNAQGLDTFIYITIGSGIGAGGMVSGKLMHGLIHPEIGHMLVPQDHTKDNFDGICSYHGNCLEGLASGPAMQKRWKVKAALDLPPNHQAWDLEANYISMALVNCILILSPQKIIVGGGVMKQKELLPKIREKVKQYLNGYIKHEKILNNIDEYIVNSQLENESGIVGTIALAEQALREKTQEKK